MTAPKAPADCFVPVPMRWRHVQPGDVMVGKNETLWLVRTVNGLGRGVVTLARTAEKQFSAPVDPDEVVRILVAAPLRDAVELTRAQLGARLTERRACPAPAPAPPPQSQPPRTT